MYGHGAGGDGEFLALSPQPANTISAHKRLFQRANRPRLHVDESASP